MNRILPRLVLCLASLSLPAAAQAWEMAGRHSVSLVDAQGHEHAIGQVTFVPEGARWRFSVQLDTVRFKDYFLSMKEFKCLEGPEVQCYVPYPYANPGLVDAADLSWLEHSLLFLIKSPKEFGAKLWNGLIYRMSVTEAGIDGLAQAIDLNQIGSPPADLTVPPYGAEARSDIETDSRWLGRLRIR
jgi:hypothetical protein